MGIVLKMALQPIISVLSFFKVFYLPKHIGVALTEDDCVSFNKVYYTIIANEDEEKQKEFASNGQQYLLASWGMVPYAYNKPVKPSTEREMLYASLGAMRNRDLNVDNTHKNKIELRSRVTALILEKYITQIELKTKHYGKAIERASC